MARVSILIVTYNSTKTITTVLESLKMQSYKDFEVILVDNASKDSTTGLVDAFKATSPFPLETIYLEDNKGFTGGNNIAFENAHCEYIALLNPDARADEDWLSELTDNLDRDRTAGICASRVLTWDGGAVDSAGDVLLSTLRCFKRESEKNNEYRKREYVFSACAAAAIYRREMIEKIGFFDEDFFIQCEDTDLSMRAQVAGWKILYIPSAVVYHKVGHSIGRASDTGIYYSQRNMEFLRMKYLPLSLLIRSMPHMLFGFTADMIYFSIRRKKARAFFRAKLDAMKMARCMLRKRKYIKKELMQVDNAYMRSLVTPLFKNSGLINMKMKKLMPTAWVEPRTTAATQGNGLFRRIFSFNR